MNSKTICIIIVQLLILVPVGIVTAQTWPYGFKDASVQLVNSDQLKCKATAKRKGPANWFDLTVLSREDESTGQIVVGHLLDGNASGNLNGQVITSTQHCTDGTDIAPPGCTALAGVSFQVIRYYAEVEILYEWELGLPQNRSVSGPQSYR